MNPPLVPHFTHLGRDIDSYLQFRSKRRIVASAAVGTAFEAIENAVWDEAAAHRQNMTIAMPMLMSAEEAQWLH